MARDLNMKQQHRKVLSEMLVLSEIWNQDRVCKYPEYLPSFDEFIIEFANLMFSEPTENLRISGDSGKASAEL